MEKILKSLLAANIVVYIFAVPFVATFVTLRDHPLSLFREDKPRSQIVHAAMERAVHEEDEVLDEATQVVRMSDRVGEPASMNTIDVLHMIAHCESGNNPYAKSNLSSAKGLLQIIDGTWSHFGCTGDVFDREDNFACGLKIATLSGLHHWDASKSCWGRFN